MNPTRHEDFFQDDDPPYLLGEEEAGVVVWRLLLDYGYMDDRYFRQFVGIDEVSRHQRVFYRPSDDILDWMRENDPDNRIEVTSKDRTVIRFTSEVAAMGFRLRFNARIVVGDEIMRMMFGLPDCEEDPPPDTTPA